MAQNRLQWLQKHLFSKYPYLEQIQKDAAKIQDTYPTIFEAFGTGEGQSLAQLSALYAEYGDRKNLWETDLGVFTSEAGFYYDAIATSSIVKADIENAQMFSAEAVTDLLWFQKDSAEEKVEKLRDILKMSKKESFVFADMLKIPKETFTAFVEETIDFITTHQPLWKNFKNNLPPKANIPVNRQAMALFQKDVQEPAKDLLAKSNSILAVFEEYEDSLNNRDDRGVDYHKTYETLSSYIDILTPYQHVTNVEKNPPHTENAPNLVPDYYQKAAASVWYFVGEHEDVLTQKMGQEAYEALCTQTIDLKDKTKEFFDEVAKYTILARSDPNKSAEPDRPLS